MRAIKIDAHAQTVTAVDVETIEQWQAIVGGYCETVMRFPSGASLLVNEDGRRDNPGVYFKIHCSPQIFIGNGLIVGAPDENGDTLDCDYDLDQLRGVINFCKVSL